MGSKGDTFMSMKKLSLKKETLLPMNDDQAQTIAGGILGTSPPFAGAIGICGGTIDTCKSDCLPCTTVTAATNCGTCATCATHCGTCATCATNCGTCATCATNCGTCACTRTVDTCRTDCVCPTGPLPLKNGGQIAICRQF